MKILSLILVFISFFLNAQDSLSLCQTIMKSYKIDYNGDSISINVSPYTFYQIEDNILYIEYSSTGTYLITGVSYLGNCYKETKFITNVIECDSTLIWIPNSFTPNDDNLNDSFGVYGINIYDFNISIYNRWGEFLFSANKITDRWSGKSPTNIPYQNDVYTYNVYYRDKYKKQHSIFGKITLIY